MFKKIEQSKELLTDIFEDYKHKQIAMFSSFGKDSVVTLDLCRQLNPDILVVSVMTPYKFKETIHYKEYLTDLWDLNIKTYIQEDYGRIFKEDITKCCNYYKVQPTKQAINELGIDVWITGLRNTEGGDMRKFTEEVEYKDDGLIKVNPILHFTEKDIWQYHAYRNIPIHPLYLRGYRSLGCQPCSAVSKDDEPERAKRWNGEKLECGIHTNNNLKEGVCNCQ